MMNNDYEIIFIDYYNKYIKSNKNETILDELLSDDNIVHYIVLRVNNFIKYNSSLNNYKEDFIQEALIAIANSFANYNSSFNVPLTAYINNNITYSFNNFKDNLRSIKISKGVEQNLNLLNSLMLKYNDESIARNLFKEKTGIIKDSTIDSYIELLNEGKDSFRINNDYFIKDENDPIKIYLSELNNQTLIKYLHLLNDKEYKFVVSYFGINCKKLNLNEIGLLYNCSKQYVYKVIKQAITKLQSSNIKKEYLDLL